MKRSTKIILSIFGVFAVLTVAGAWLAVLFVADNAERWAGQAKDKVSEGRAAGSTLDSGGCVKAAMARYREDPGPISAFGERLWLNGCLETATPDTGICPESTAESITGRIGELIAQRAAFCVKHGAPGDQDCQQLAQEVEEFCTNTPPAETASNDPIETAIQTDAAIQSASEAAQSADSAEMASRP